MPMTTSRARGLAWAGGRGRTAAGGCPAGGCPAALRSPLGLAPAGCTGEYLSSREPPLPLPTPPDAVCCTAMFISGMPLFSPP